MAPARSRHSSGLPTKVDLDCHSVSAVICSRAHQASDDNCDVEQWRSRPADRSGLVRPSSGFAVPGLNAEAVAAQKAGIFFDARARWSLVR